MLTSGKECSQNHSRKIIVVVSLALLSTFMVNFSTAQNINDSTHFPDPNFLSYVESYMGGDFTAADAAAKTGVFSPIYKNISDLTGIEFFTGIQQLKCYGNQLTSLDVSSNTALTYLRCDNNQLTSLVVSNNTALTSLRCDNNQLTSLDVSNNTALTSLQCYDNQLTSLDVSNNTALTYLYCYTNQLTSLDVSNNTALTYLRCDNNQLTSLVVSNNTALTNLECQNNQLTSIDVTNSTALTIFKCGDNQLTSLDVFNNTALYWFWCQRNQLTSLDVSNNTALYWFWCSTNQLTNLNVSNNTALKTLSCDDNQLTNISSLVANTGLGSGDYVNVMYNNLSCDDWAAILILQSRIGAEFHDSPQNGLNPFSCPSIDTSYLVNGDGTGGGSGRYWPGYINSSYFDARFIPATALGGEETYPAWCADMLTIIRLGMWYSSIGIYTSETDVCSLVGNPENFDLVNYLLVNYRYGLYVGVDQNVIQAVIWKLLFNGETPQVGGDGISSGGYISWDNSLATSIYNSVLTNGRSYPPDYANNTFLPITIIIDTGDQVNLLEIPYWMYLEFVDLGIVGDCQ